MIVTSQRGLLQIGPSSILTSTIIPTNMANKIINDLDFEVINLYQSKFNQQN